MLTSDGGINLERYRIPFSLGKAIIYSFASVPLTQHGISVGIKFKPSCTQLENITAAGR